jgi:hypothetical protein
MPKSFGIFCTSSLLSGHTHSAHTNNLMQDAYNMTYKAWAIMVLIPLILTTILVMIAWGEVSFKTKNNPVFSSSIDRGTSIPVADVSASIPDDLPSVSSSQNHSYKVKKRIKFSKKCEFNRRKGIISGNAENEEAQFNTRLAYLEPLLESGLQVACQKVTKFQVVQICVIYTEKPTLPQTPY